MNILILDRALGNSYSFGLVGGLRENGLDVSLAGPANWSSHEVLPFYRRRTVPGESRAAKLTEGTIGVWRAARYSKSIRPDILHLQWPSLDDVILARVMTTTCQARVVFTLHNPIPRHATDRDRFYAFALRMASQIIVHGPTLRIQLLERHPELETKINCVELGNYDHVITRFTTDEARTKLGLVRGRPVYAFLGSVRPRKGVEIFMRALAACRDEGIDACGFVAGVADDDEYLAELITLGTTLGIGSSLHWEVDPILVAQDRLDMVASASDQIVLPFLGASQSASVVLGMTHGRCVVTSALGELPRTLEGRGLLIPPDSVEDLAAAMRIVVDNPGLCEQLGTLAREYAVSELSWNRIGAETLNVYERALEAS
jgi:glycosyltransferase involved in cell wall biosynthesis